MKTKIIRSWILIVIIALLSAPLTTNALALEKRVKSGGTLGIEAGGMRSLEENEYRTITIIPKFGVQPGYRLNPYLTLSADIWSIFFMLYAFEGDLKINITNTSVSPYVRGSIGIVTSLFGGKAPTATGGTGIDIQASKNWSASIEGRFRNSWDTSIVSENDSLKSVEASFILTYHF